MNPEIVFEIGKKYKFVYNDLGFKPVTKEGIILSKENNMLKLDSNEILNMNQIIRAWEVKV